MGSGGVSRNNNYTYGYGGGGGGYYPNYPAPQGSVPVGVYPNPSLNSNSQYPRPPQMPGPPPPQQIPSWWLQFIQQGQQMSQQGPGDNPYIQNTANVAGQLQNLNTQNITLNPAVLSAINAIRQAQIGAVNRAYTQNKSGVLQDLYGRGMAQSSNALDKGNRLGEFLAQGLSQAEADAGARQLQAYQEAYQNRLSALTGSGNLYNQLAGTNQQALEDAFRNKLAAMNQTFGYGQQAFDVQNQNQQAAYDYQWKQYQNKLAEWQRYMDQHPELQNKIPPPGGGAGQQYIPRNLPFPPNSQVPYPPQRYGYGAY